MWKVNILLKMELEYCNEVLFVRLNGNLNHHNSYKINNYLIGLIKKHQIQYLVYNLENLNEIDTSGMEALINTKCAIKINKGQIYLCNLNNKINNYLKPLRIKIADNEIMARYLMEAI